MCAIAHIFMCDTFAHTNDCTHKKWVITLCVVFCTFKNDIPTDWCFDIYNLRISFHRTLHKLVSSYN